MTTSSDVTNREVAGRETLPTARPKPSTPRYGRSAFEPAGEPTFSFEVLVVSGEEAAELQTTQARAIKELLEWLATERQVRERSE